MKIYAVKKGRVPGVYRNWDEAKKQVDGFPALNINPLRISPMQLIIWAGKKSHMKKQSTAKMTR